MSRRKDSGWGGVMKEEREDQSKEEKCGKWEPMASGGGGQYCAQHGAVDPSGVTPPQSHWPWHPPTHHEWSSLKDPVEPRRGPQRREATVALGLWAVALCTSSFWQEYPVI